MAFCLFARRRGARRNLCHASPFPASAPMLLGWRRSNSASDERGSRMISWHLRQQTRLVGSTVRSARRSCNCSEWRVAKSSAGRSPTAGTDLGKPRPATRRAAGQAGQPGAGTSRRQPAAFPRHRRRLQPGIRRRPVRQLPGHLRPWLWLLTRTSDCRIFQNQRSRTSSSGCSATSALRLRGRLVRSTASGNAACSTARPVDFVSRLMEQEGIYYWFRHEQSRHILMLSDAYGAHQSPPNYASVPYYRRPWNSAGATISTTGTWRARCSPAH